VTHDNRHDTNGVSACDIEHNTHRTAPTYLVPVGNRFVRDTGRHIEHDDSCLTTDVVAITQSTELLLTGLWAGSTSKTHERVSTLLVGEDGWARREGAHTVSQQLKMTGPWVVWNGMGCTSTPIVAVGKEAGAEEWRVSQSEHVRRGVRSVHSLHTDVFLLELAGFVALDEGGLTDTTITNCKHRGKREREESGAEDNSTRGRGEGTAYRAAA
jgi:hypothetical protein